MSQSVASTVLQMHSGSPGGSFMGATRRGAEAEAKRIADKAEAAKAVAASRKHSKTSATLLMQLTQLTSSSSAYLRISVGGRAMAMRLDQVLMIE
eukprot:363029-Chlamydomonas_euryale.AAC.4